MHVKIRFRMWEEKSKLKWKSLEDWARLERHPARKANAKATPSVFIVFPQSKDDTIDRTMTCITVDEI